MVLKVLIKKKTRLYAAPAVKGLIIDRFIRISNISPTFTNAQLLSATMTTDLGVRLLLPHRHLSLTFYKIGSFM